VEKKGLFELVFDFHLVSDLPPCQVEIWKLMRGKIGVKIRRRGLKIQLTIERTGLEFQVPFKCVFAASFGTILMVFLLGFWRYES